MVAGSLAELLVLQGRRMLALPILSWQHSAGRECKPDEMRPQDCMRLAPNCIAGTTSTSQQQEAPALSETVPRVQEAAAAAGEEEQENKEEVHYGNRQAHAGEKGQQASGLFMFASK
jgi:hypothetical protein